MLNKEVVIKKNSNINFEPATALLQGQVLSTGLSMALGENPRMEQLSSNQQTLCIAWFQSALQ